MTLLQVGGPPQTETQTPTSPSRVRRLALPLASLAAAGTVALIVHDVNPNQPGHYPTCPFLFITGWYCPGCGSLRAIHALTNGDVGTALARNPMTVIMLVVLAGLWVGSVRRRWSGRPRTWVAPAWVLWGFLGVVIAFWILRNLPGMTWLSPA